MDAFTLIIILALGLCVAMHLFGHGHGHGSHGSQSGYGDRAARGGERNEPGSQAGSETGMGNEDEHSRPMAGTGHRHGRGGCH